MAAPAPAPTPAADAAAPTFAVPTLPAAGTPPPTPTREEASEPQPADDESFLRPGAQRVPSEVPSWKQRQTAKRKVARRIKSVVALGALGAGGFYAYQNYIAPSSTTEAADVEAAAVAPLLPVSPDAATTPSARSDVGIIADAQDVVADINENGEEAVAIELLAPIDPFVTPDAATIVSSAEVTAGATSVATAQSYSFNWSYPGGTEITAWVDASTGDYQMTASGDLVVRNTDGSVHQQDQPGGAWAVSPAPDLADRAFVGRDRLITVTTIVPDGLMAYVTASDIDDDGFGSYLLDDAALSDGDATLRTSWLTMWGFDATTAAAKPTADMGAMPRVAGPGQILIRVDGGLDQVVTTASVSTAAGTSTYSLIDASMSARSIAVPA